MRAWMQGQKAPWTAADLCKAIGLPPGPQRDRVRIDLRDFVGRGEIAVARGQILNLSPAAKRNRRQNLYQYNPDHRANDREGALKQRIYKAMYVSVTEFALTDIRRLADIRDRSYLDKLTRRLTASGQVRVVGRRRCAHGAGAEKLYQVVNRDRFRTEVMR